MAKTFAAELRASPSRCVRFDNCVCNEKGQVENLPLGVADAIPYGLVTYFCVPEASITAAAVLPIPGSTFCGTHRRSQPGTLLFPLVLRQSGQVGYGGDILTRDLDHNVARNYPRTVGRSIDHSVLDDHSFPDRQPDFSRDLGYQIS